MPRYRTRVVPKSYYEVVQALLLIILSAVVFLNDVCILYEMMFHFSNAVFLTLGLLLGFVALNVVGNYLQFVLVDTSILTAASFNDIHDKWQVCPVCEIQVPPRSFHCHICNICILKRDHHCVFTGCCSGYFNHRYYIGLVTYLWCGAGLSLILNCCSKSLWPMMVANGWWSVIYSVCPVLFWLMGFTELMDFFTFLMTVVTLYGFLFLTGLLVYHWNLIVRGQTAFENTRNDKAHALRTWKENVIEVLGSRWLTTLFWFAVSSPLPGDGQTFSSVASKTE